MSVYNPNIPQASDLVSNSQGQLLTNFSQLNTQFGVDHSAFEAGGSNGTGFHNQVTFPTAVVAAPTGVVGIIHDVIAGAGTISFAGKPIPYFANSVGDFPIMPDIKKGTGNDYSFQIGKLIVNFGSNVTAGTSATVVFNQPFTNDNYSVSLTANGISSLLFVTNPITTQLTIRATNGNINCYYIAIGY